MATTVAACLAWRLATGPQPPPGALPFRSPLFTALDEGEEPYFGVVMPQSAIDTQGSRWLARFTHPASWCAIASVFLVVDFITGPGIQFPVAAIVSVALAAWHRGFRWALPFALGQPTVLFVFNFFWEVPWHMSLAVVNLLIRVAVLGGFAWFAAVTARQRRRISALERLLCICAWCKRIRDKHETWQPLETYLSNQSESAITHGICTDCLGKAFPEP
jgi:hypothetical protein